MSRLSTHVLDLSRGVPAAGVAVLLSRWENATWVPVVTRTTDADGRIRDLLAPEFEARTEAAASTLWQLRFETGAYFSTLGVAPLHPFVEIAFYLAPAGHHHIPLLVTPFAYSTYRGS